MRSKYSTVALDGKIDMLIDFSHIMIGISEKEFPTNKLLGSSKKSYAYKSDGKIFNAKTTGEDFGPKFERHDIIGCGLIMSKKQIFFTLNGRFIGNAFNNVDIEKECLFPSVCLQALSEEVSTNFTGTSVNPFAYDI